MKIRPPFCFPMRVRYRPEADITLERYAMVFPCQPAHGQSSQQTDSPRKLTMESTGRAHVRLPTPQSPFTELFC